MPVVSGLLIVLAIFVFLGSWLSVSNATAGVAGTCSACFLIILARIAQADSHHSKLIARLTAAPLPVPFQSDPRT
jgi:hypothetical protein